MMLEQQGRYRVTLWLLVLLSLLGGTTLAAQVRLKCSFPLDTSSASLPSLRALAGIYELEWHITAKEGSRRPPAGRLWLWLASPADSSSNEPRYRPAPGDTIRFPLVGLVAPRKTPLSAGGSLRRTLDPIDPPVVLESLRPGEAALLFGTVATRRAGVIVLDGGGIGVWLTHISPTTLAGEFSAWGIVMEDSGYLCARRVP